MSASTKRKERQAAREAGVDKKLLAAQREAELKAKSRRRWTLGTVAVALLIAVILFLNSGFLYSNTTALTIGDENYSPAEFGYQYANQYYNLANQYGSYASFIGLDTSTGVAGLADQACSMLEEGGTWQDYFMEVTKTAMTQYKAIEDYAAAEGITLSEEELAQIDAEVNSIDEFAREQGYSNGDNFLAANYGEGVNKQLAREAAVQGLIVNKAAVGYTEALEYTAEELDAQYESYNGDKDYFDYAYYYVMSETVEDEEGNYAATEETKAAAKAKAEAVLAAYAALGNEESEDDEETAVKPEMSVEERLNAALAEAGIADASCISTTGQGQALGAYAEWMKAQTVAGEATVVENEAGSGYYVVAFIARNDNDYNLAQVRHILVKAAADETGAFTDEAKAEAKAKAEEILAQWEAGEATEESFAALANELSEDGGSNTNGGLYDTVQKGQMVEEFDAFCFAKHKSGDTGIVYGEVAGSYAGYHVMYYVGEGENCADYIARTELANADSQAWLEELVSGYEAIEKFWIKLAV